LTEFRGIIAKDIIYNLFPYGCDLKKEKFHFQAFVVPTIAGNCFLVFEINACRGFHKYHLFNDCIRDREANRRTGQGGNTDFSSGSGGKNKPSIKEQIERAKSRLSKNEYKAAKSNYNRMVEHVEKLEKYKQDPLKYDHLGLLKNAPNEQVKQKIIQSRIAHLEKEIQTFYDNIVKIIN
jgi:hypothetical protein